MKTKVLLFVLASAFLAMLVMGCEGTVGSDGADGAPGAPGKDSGGGDTVGTTVVPVDTLAKWVSAYNNPSVGTIQVTADLSVGAIVLNGGKRVIVDSGKTLEATTLLATDGYIENNGTVKTTDKFTNAAKYGSFAQVINKGVMDLDELAASSAVILSGKDAALEIADVQYVGGTEPSFTVAEGTVLTVNNNAGTINTVVNAGTLTAAKAITFSATLVTVQATATFDFADTSPSMKTGELVGVPGATVLFGTGTIPAIDGFIKSLKGTYTCVAAADWGYNVADATELKTAATTANVKSVIVAEDVTTVAMEPVTGLTIRVRNNAVLTIGAALNLANGKINIESGELKTTTTGKISNNAAGDIDGSVGSKITLVDTTSVVAANGLVPASFADIGGVYTRVKDSLGWTINTTTATQAGKALAATGIAGILAGGTGTATASANTTVATGIIVNLGALDLALTDKTLAVTGTLTTTGDITGTSAISGVGSLTAGDIKATTIKLTEAGTLTAASVTGVDGTALEVSSGTGDITVPGAITNNTGITVKTTGKIITGNIVATDKPVTVGLTKATGTITTGDITGGVVTVGVSDAEGAINVGTITASDTVSVIVKDATVVTKAITTVATKHITVNAGNAKVTTSVTATGASNVTIVGIPQNTTSVSMVGAGILTINTDKIAGAATAALLVNAADAIKVLVANEKLTMTITAATAAVKMTASAEVVIDGNTAIVITGDLETTATSAKISLTEKDASLTVTGKLTVASGDIVGPASGDTRVNLVIGSVAGDDTIDGLVVGGGTYNKFVAATPLWSEV